MTNVPTLFIYDHSSISCSLNWSTWLILLPFICRQSHQQPPNWWQQPQSDDEDEARAFSRGSNGKRSRIEPITSSSTASSEAKWPPSTSSRRESTRIRISSPPLPDEELTSVLQNFLNESRGRKMEAGMTSNDYYYGSADPYYNSNFLPNVSPSASSLDSGYCGPASVQSSIGNF